MGLKESGLRGSLRNVSVGIDAIPDSVILLPESDDLDHFGGDTGQFTIDDTSPVYEPFESVDNNQLSLKLPAATNEIGSSSGLDNYPSTDTTFRFAVQPATSDDSVRLAYSTDTPNDHENGDSYAIDINPDNGFIRSYYWDGGSFGDILIDADLSWNLGEMHSVEFLHESDGSITCSVFDKDGATLVDAATASDSTYITDGNFDNTGISVRVESGDPDAVDLWYLP